MFINNGLFKKTGFFPANESFLNCFDWLIKDDPRKIDFYKHVNRLIAYLHD